MKTAQKIAFYLIICISFLVVLASLLSLIDGLSYWFSGILDFPRLQYLLLSVICLILLFILRKKSGRAFYLLCSGLIAALVIQSIKIYPYVLGEKTVPDISAMAAEDNSSVKILIANVLMTNKQSGDFLKIVEKANPDILLVMEVNEWWISKLQNLKETYPYIMEYPDDNAYGMALYSRFPLNNKKMNFFNHKNVPSFHSEVKLPSGESFMFHGVHPMAPVPSGKYPDNAGREEVTLAKMGEIVKKDTMASMVVGDFNDVSWSNTSRMFEKQGNLNNVRLGRGLFNSFNANNILMRWPLDHFFVTQEFSLVKLDRLSAFGSDHFPMYAEFILRD